MNNRAWRWDSSSETRRLTVASGMPRRRAPADRLPPSTTASRTDMASRRSMLFQFVERLSGHFAICLTNTEGTFYRESRFTDAQSVKLADSTSHERRHRFIAISVQPRRSGILGQTKLRPRLEYRVQIADFQCRASACIWLGPRREHRSRRRAQRHGR